MRFISLLVLILFVLAPGALFAGTFLYTANSALPSASNWQVYGTSSYENGTGITSTIVADGSLTCWKLVDGSGLYRCMERRTTLSVSFDTGATIAFRIKCTNSLLSSHNIGITNGSGGMYVDISANLVELTKYDGTVVGSYSGSGASYHTYYLSVKNGTSGNNATAVWRLYRDGVEIITYTGAGGGESYSGFFAGHDGPNGLGTGTWYFDCIAARNDGAFSPSQWSTALPLGPPLPPTVTSPADGEVVASAAEITWQGDAHDAWEVHVNSGNGPNSVIEWDSGEVWTGATSCFPSNPGDGTYYIFARHHNAVGWGDWSATGHTLVVDSRLRIIPEPQEITWKSDPGFLIGGQTKIIVGDNVEYEDWFTAEKLRQKIWAVTGYLPEILEATTWQQTTDAIVIGDPAKNPALATMLETWPEAAGKEAKSEGYLLGIKDGAIIIRGFDQAGTFYGCQSLIQLIENYGQGRIPAAFCYDYPAMAWRGTMIRIWDNMDATFLKELISQVMARHKLNVLQLDLGLGFIWPSHPELYYGLPPEEQRSNPTTLQAVVPIVEWARQHFMEVIPAGPSWSHADALITGGTLNGDLREDPLQNDPANGLETLCTRHPQAQQIMHDLWNDMITYLAPNYIHTGWDEISAIGNVNCPRCAGYTPRTLFSEALWNDRNWLAAKGITPVMWADMLRPDMNGGSPWNLSQTMSTMPRDTILEDWEYLDGRDNSASAARWNSYGQPWLASPYGGYNPFEVNIYNWANITQQYPNNGMVAFNKFRCGTKQATFNNSYQYMEVANMVFYGEYGWSPGRPGISPLPYSGESIVRKVISPDVPANFTATATNGQVELHWTNPPDSDFVATRIVYSADGNPQNPFDGHLLVDLPGGPGQAMTFTHADAPLGTTVYYAAFSRDGVKNFSPAATVSVVNGPPVKLGELHSVPNGRYVRLMEGIATCFLDGCFYITNEKRTAGIRVEWLGVRAVRDIMIVNGTLADGPEGRYIDAASAWVIGQKPPGDKSVEPIAVAASRVGGSDKGYTPGGGGIGLSNMGLLVKVFGKIERITPGESFYINDGSKTGGVKVMLTGARTPLSVPSGTYASVTGVVSLDEDGPVLRPASQEDMVGME